LQTVFCGPKSELEEKIEKDKKFVLNQEIGYFQGQLPRLLYRAINNSSEDPKLSLSCTLLAQMYGTAARHY